MTAIDLEPAPNVEALFYRLIEILGAHAPTSNEAMKGRTGTQEVVYEIQLDNGCSYTLTRTYSDSARDRITLSPREKEIIRLICEGLPNKAISDVLEISPWTVATYIKRIFAKLAVCSRAEMVARVLQDRLLENPNHQLN